MLTKMSLRRRAALGLGALVLVPTLASCGFDYATAQIYTPAEGLNDRSGTIDVLNAVIVSAEDGSGNFLATFSNNSLEEATTFVSLNSEVLQASDFAPIEIPTADVGVANLATEEEPIQVTGEAVKAGYYVPIVLEFGNGQQTQMKAVVVEAEDHHEGFGTPLPTPFEEQEDQGGR